MAVSVSVSATDAGRVGGVSGLNALYLGTGRGKLWPGGAAASANPCGGPAGVGAKARYVLLPFAPLVGRGDNAVTNPADAWKSAGSGKCTDLRSGADGRRAMGGIISGGAANGVGGGDSSAIGDIGFGASRCERSKRSLARAPSPKEDDDRIRRWLSGPGLSSMGESGSSRLRRMFRCGMFASRFLSLCTRRHTAKITMSRAMPPTPPPAAPKMASSLTSLLKRSSSIGAEETSGSDDSVLDGDSDGLPVVVIEGVAATSALVIGSADVNDGMADELATGGFPNVDSGIRIWNGGLYSNWPVASSLIIRPYTAFSGIVSMPSRELSTVHAYCTMTGQSSQ
jgi:hypothetical protein